MTGLIIFLAIVLIFLYLYFRRGLYEALIISSIIATMGVLFIPDVILTSFYLRLFGRWHLIIITMNQVKLIIIASSILFILYLRENKGKITGVIT